MKYFNNTNINISKEIIMYIVKTSNLFRHILMYLKSLIVEFLSKMIEAHARKDCTNKNNLTDSVNSRKELDSLTGKCIKLVA